MGTLVYNGRVTLAIEDRVLAHLQVVVVNKLRRREAFAFTWNDGGRSTVCWLHPSIALEFVYSGNRQPLLNREWLEMMAGSANTNSGLFVMPEPAPATRIDEQHPQSPVELQRPAQPKRPSSPVPEPVSA